MCVCIAQNLFNYLLAVRLIRRWIGIFFPIGFDKRHFIASATMLAVRLEEFASMSTKLSTEGIIDTQTKLIESDRPASLLPQCKYWRVKVNVIFHSHRRRMWLTKEFQGIFFCLSFEQLPKSPIIWTIFQIINFLWLIHVEKCIPPFFFSLLESIQWLTNKSECLNGRTIYDLLSRRTIEHSIDCIPFIHLSLIYGRKFQAKCTFVVCVVRSRL